MQIHIYIAILFTAITTSAAQQGQTFRMDRNNTTGQRYSDAVSGDTITSDVLDLQQASSVSVSYRVRRVYPPSVTNRRWKDDPQYGPELTTRWDSKRFPGDSLILQWYHPTFGWTTLQHVNTDQYMNEPDFSNVYRSRTVVVPDTLIGGSIQDRASLQYRLILRGRAHTLHDDEDPYDVTDLRVFVDDDGALAVVAADLTVPYSRLPYHQASALPWRVSITNRTGAAWMDVQIHSTFQRLDGTGSPLTVDLGVDTIAPFQNVIASIDRVDLRSLFGADTTSIIATTIVEDNIGVALDTLITRHFVQLGRTLAYDNYEAEGHHVVAQEYGQPSNFGLRTPEGSGQDDDVFARYGGSPAPDQVGPGGMTMSFRLYARDTLFGYQFAFDRETVRDTACEVSISRVVDVEQAEVISESVLTFRPGMSTTGVATDTISELQLSAPIVLEPGAYEMRLIQRGHEVLNLCATSSRAGVLIQSASSDPLWGQMRIADPSWYVDHSTISMDVEDRSAPPFPFWNDWQDRRGRPFVGQRGYIHFCYGDETGKYEGEHTFKRGVWVPVMRLTMGGSLLVSSLAEERSMIMQGATWSPNPAADRATITPPSGRPINVELTTLQGVIIWHGLIDEPTTLDISSFATGTYVLRSVMDGHARSRTVVIID